MANKTRFVQRAAAGTFLLVALWGPQVAFGGTIATFEGLGVLPGKAASLAYNVSADGKVVTGYSGAGIGATPNYAFRWTHASGMQSIGHLQGGIESYAYGISADGSSIVGFADTATSTAGFRWTSAGMASIGTPGGGTTQAFGVSGDASTVSGWGWNSSAGSRALRWTTSGGIEFAPTPNGWTATYAYGISDDASTVVGWGQTANGKRAFRWTADGVHDLGVAPGYNHFTAGLASADGSVICGNMSVLVSGPLVPFRWTISGGYEVLVRPSGLPAGPSGGMSRDGSTIVGSGTNSAWYWTRQTGVVDLSTVLTAAGLDLSGWTLTNATGASADGSTIVGFGLYNGRTEGWIATIPGPGGLSILCLGGVFMTRRRHCSK